MPEPRVGIAVHSAQCTLHTQPVIYETNLTASTNYQKNALNRFHISHLLYVVQVRVFWVAGSSVHLHHRTVIFCALQMHSPTVVCLTTRWWRRKYALHLRVQALRAVRRVADYPYDDTAALDRKNAVAQQWIYLHQPYVFQFANSSIFWNLFGLKGNEDVTMNKQKKSTLRTNIEHTANWVVDFSPIIFFFNLIQVEQLYR